MTKGQSYFYKALKSLKKEGNTNEPLILKAYGLDNESLLIKAIHLITFNSFINTKDNYKKCL